MSEVCVAIVREERCIAAATHRFTAMCVHEHLHGPVGLCGWHAKLVAAMQADGELGCNPCRKAGDPDAALDVQIVPWQVAS